MSGDITLNQTAVAAVTGLLGAMALAIGGLWYAYRSAMQAQVKREQDLTSEILPSVQDISRTVLGLVEVNRIGAEESRIRYENQQREMQSLRELILRAIPPEPRK